MLAVRLAPARILVAGSAVAVAVFLLDVWFALSVPWLGLKFDAPATGEGIVVARAFNPGPAYGTLKPGDVITAIEAPDGTLLPVSAVTISRATYSLPTYAAFNRFFEDHRALWGAIGGEAVTLVRADGTRATLHPHRHRAVASLPLDFWAMDLLAALALLIGVGVWAFKPNDIAPRMLFVACFGLTLTAAILALGKGRELTFDAGWLQPLWATEQLGEHLALFGLLALLWVYPRRFRPTRYLLPVGALFFGAWLAGQFQWWPRPGASGPLTTTAVFFLGFIPLSVWQWRATRAHPADRAALKILLVAVLFPIGTFVLANRAPIALGLPPLVFSGWGEASLVLFIYLGLALGVARYRLFNLDRWWFEALVWGLGGALVLLFDTALLWLNASAGLALGAAVAAAGWLYFPLRQWLWRRLSPAARLSVERHLPPLIDSLFSADSSAALQDNWRRLLEQIYAPLSISASAAPVATVAVAREGLVLQVPALGDAPALELHHAGKGQRLFTSADATLAGALLALTQQAARARRALDERAAEGLAGQREKELLLQDLHDGLGGMVTNIGMLAALAQKEQDLAAMQSRLATIGELAKASLAEIRGVMYSLDDSDADWSAIAGDLRAYGRKLVEPHGLGFEMQAAITEAAPPPDSVMRLNLARIFKEALTNVVKHAQARQVSVRLDVAPHELQLVVQDDGIGLPPQLAEGPAKSRGLGNLHRRAERLGGRLSIGPTDHAAGPGTAVRLHLPLPTKCPVSGDAAAPAVR
jgi:signal transduction histidine kinase